MSLDGDRGWINADGTDSVSFTLTADGEALSSGYTLWYSYYDEPFYELTGNTFSTMRGGAHYSFMASYGGAWSNKVSVFVPGAEPDMPELRIELSASSVVKGDAVPLKVYENGRDVTSSSEIYIAGLPVPEKLDGNVFLSTEPGVYGIYARKDGRVSDTIPLSVLSGASGTRTVFAEGVTAESGWHDVNKRPASRSSNEFLMCYAATASNLIEWWQTEWQKLGLTLPSGARTGAGTTPYGDEGHKFELAVFEEYYEGWNPNVGSQIEYALEWYFEGLHKGPYFPEDQGQPFDPVSGAHYLENEETFRKHQGWGYINLYPGSGRSGLSWEGRTGDEQKLIFSSVIRNAIDNGIAGLNINPSGASNVHAISLWGYEVDEATEIVTAIWVTDSDSYLTSPSDVKIEEKMERCPVVYENGGRVSFMRPSIGKSPIVSVVALSSPHA